MFQRVYFELLLVSRFECFEIRINALLLSEFEIRECAKISKNRISTTRWIFIKKRSTVIKIDLKHFTSNFQ